MSQRLLWIEDGALVEFPEYLADLYARFDYVIDLARDASEGFAMLRRAEVEPYDAVVVDLRLPPGSDPVWGQLYLHHHSNLAAARLGIVLLAVAFGRSRDFLKERGLPSQLLEQFASLAPPAWPAKYPGKFGILTVEEESEVQPLLGQLGLQNMHVRTKQVEKGPRILSDLVAALVTAN